MRAVERITALQAELTKVKALNLTLTQELEARAAPGGEGHRGGPPAHGRGAPAGRGDGGPGEAARRPRARAGRAGGRARRGPAVAAGGPSGHAGRRPGAHARSRPRSPRRKQALADSLSEEERLAASWSPPRTRPPRCAARWTRSRASAMCWPSRWPRSPPSAPSCSRPARRSRPCTARSARPCRASTRVQSPLLFRSPPVLVTWRAFSRLEPWGAGEEPAWVCRTRGGVGALPANSGGAPSAPRFSPSLLAERGARLLEEGHFLRSRLPAERGVAVGEAPEARDDVVVAPGVLQHLGA